MTSCAKPRKSARNSNVILLLENEMACNTGTGEEAVEVLKAIPNKNFMLNWDPGNAATFPDNTPYPTAITCCPKIASVTATART